MLEPFPWDMFWLFWKKPKKGDFVSQFSPWKMHWQKKQSTPRRRTRKNEEDGSLRFFRRPPESGLILHTSCVIYDVAGRLRLVTWLDPDCWLASLGRRYLAASGEGSWLALGEGTFDPVKVWYAPGSLRLLGAINLKLPFLTGTSQPLPVGLPKP